MTFTKIHLRGRLRLTIAFFSAAIFFKVHMPPRQLPPSDTSIVLNLARVAPQSDNKNKPIEQKDAETTNDVTTAGKKFQFRGLDIFIIGWPKCGTTSMMHWLGSVDTPTEQIIMPKKEIYTLLNWRMHSQERVMTELDNDLTKEEEIRMANQPQNSTNTSRKVFYGIKCPSEIHGDMPGIKILLKYSNLTERTPKLIVVIRHPVRALESFYNHRVREAHNKDSWLGKTHPQIPNLNTLLNGDTWHGVGGKNVQYNVYLDQLDKTSSFSTFLYSVEQMESDSRVFKQSLQSFLGLQMELKTKHSISLQCKYGQ